MSTVTLYPGGPPAGIDLGASGAVVTNIGAGSVDYSDTAEPFVAEGTIAATASATLTGTQFFRATAGSTLSVVEADADLGSLEEIRASLLAVESGGVNVYSIVAGNLGAAYALDLAAKASVRLFGTLSANCALTTTGWKAGTSRVELILKQDATGGRTLTINGSPVTIPTAANTAMNVVLDTDDGGITIFVSVPAAAGATGAAGADQTATITANTQTGSYTLVLADLGKAVEMNSGSATVLTVPPNSSVAFPVGSVIEVFRLGAGSVTITPGAGVTIPNVIQPAGTSSRTIAGQCAGASLRKRATDEWALVGHLA